MFQNYAKMIANHVSFTIDGMVTYEKLARPILFAGCLFVKLLLLSVIHPPSYFAVPQSSLSCLSNFAVFYETMFSTTIPAAAKIFVV